ncbi:hypothetical protein ACHRVW_05070 [Flavobacterium collinsii]|uniref:Cytochrome c domain-containing protein n=1 Tax=Flavobacterium collinsii TaxID=1114861 RepID=A0ABN7EMC4_9FLAO|nr:hypothetical protein [Flavobacterium collinsii]CAA9200521.1 hypothetical protein FLACOL7796_03305 [Flavobacterium collinsii]
MKKKQIIIALLLVAIAASLGVFFYYKNNEKGVDGVYATSAAPDSCECETSWFPHEQTPAPKEGDGSPFDSDNTTNCDFHQWSWQKFLWVTKPLPSGNPFFIDSLDIVSPEMEDVAPQLGIKLTLSSINQAGFKGVLLSNPKFNKVADTVYYSIHVNKLLKDKAISAASLINNGKLPVSNSETFPVGALELKVSWISIDAIVKEQQKDYFTTTAAVKNSKGQYVKKTMALLGMHVVGIVKNHPEFIWATFEHKDMAPVYDKKNNLVTSATEKLFYEKGTEKDINGIRWLRGATSPVLPNKAFILYEYGVPKDLNTGDFMATSQKEPANFNNIENINKCVDSKLKDVFRNYFYNGSVWLDFDGVSPEDQVKTLVTKNISSAIPGALARGSVNLANITMETYTQTFQDDIHKINSGTLVSCFYCHQASNSDKTRPGKSPLFLSHLFADYLQFTKPAGTAKNANVLGISRERRIQEIDAAKMDQLEEFIKATK